MKAYRPGLRPQQYKSLLANSAAAFSSERDVLPIQQTGAGLLDVGAAVRSTLAVAPSALDFGVGGGTVDSTQRFMVQNLSGTADTFSIAATALNDGVMPQVTPNSLELAPGASAESPSALVARVFPRVLTMALSSCAGLRPMWLRVFLTGTR